MQCSLDWGSEATSYERTKRLQFPQKFEIPDCISSYQLLKRHLDSWSWKFLYQFPVLCATLVDVLLIFVCYNISAFLVFLHLF